MVWMYERREYGEMRQCALALIRQRRYFAAFVDRGDVRRVISLRRANIREVNHYATND
jgi:uncharacterized DUF497 family protein